jgi:hypothetical protein
MMSEFDKLAGDAEQEVKDHPQQVHEAEQDAEHAAESKFGDGKDHDQGDQGDGSGQGDQSDGSGQGDQSDGGGQSAQNQ